jgi:hypothetical protein
LKYCPILAQIRTKPGEESIKIIGEYINQNPHSIYVEPLKDERRLLKGEEPKRKQLFVQLYNFSDIHIDGKIDKSEWKDASQIHGFGPGENSKVYFFLTKEKLYIGGTFYFEEGPKP